MDKNWPNLFIKLKKAKKTNYEINLPDGFLGWKGYHPDLIPSVKGKYSKKFLCLAKKNDRNIFQHGILKPLNSDKFFIEIKRKNNDYISHIHGHLDNKFSYQTIAFLQRGGHGIKQGEAFDIVTHKGYKGAIFSPQLGNFSTKADKYPAKYLDEVGFTTHLRTNKKGEIQANLPTDPSDERFLLSLLAMIGTNWTFFLCSCHAELAIIDSKAEAGALAASIQKGINPKLKIALIAYTLYDNLKRIPKEMVLPYKEIRRRLAIAGMKKYGVPDGLRFMQEKIDSVKNNKNSIIVYMSFQNKKEIENRAKKNNVKNLLVIPQISPKITFKKKPAKKETQKHKIHVIRLNSSTYLQVKKVLSVFFRVAEALPQDKFFLIAKEEQYPDILPAKPPPNFKYLGWVETNRSLTKYLVMADTLWVHGGNRPSVIESIHANKTGVLPIFFTQDQLTEESVRFWGKRKFSLIKLLALMMAVEPNVERWEMLTTIEAQDKILQNLVVNPLKPNIDKLIKTIKKKEEILSDVQLALSKLPVATTDMFAKIYIKLLEGKGRRTIEKECRL